MTILRVLRGVAPSQRMTTAVTKAAPTTSTHRKMPTTKRSAACRTCSCVGSSMQIRGFHAAHPVAARPRTRMVPGQGGDTEEFYISRAIQNMRGMKPQIVLEVMNACHAGIASQLFPAPAILRDAPTLIRILTRADLLSDDALRYQMEQASWRWPRPRHDARTKYRGNAPEASARVAVIAMDLQQAENIKMKQLNPLIQVLDGAMQLQDPDAKGGTTTILVCGLPNAGKSSLILGLTRHRTMQVRKKMGYHLPKISPTAGWTLGTKRHVLEVPKGGRALTLVDTPGLRPRMERLDPQSKAHLLAAGSMDARKGMLDVDMQERILSILGQGLQRHAQLSSSSLSSAADATIDIQELLRAHGKKHPNLKGVGLVQHFMTSCRHGAYGGLVMEQEQGENEKQKKIYQPSMTPGEDEPLKLSFSRGRVVVAMSKYDEKVLIQNERKRSQEHISKPSRMTFDEISQTETALTREEPKTSRKYIKSNRKEILRLPEYQQNLRCMKCAGFIKVNSLGEMFGKRYDKVINWDKRDILCFFSRVAEVFGAEKSRHKRYLLEYSLACTMAAKHKLSSRRKTYKKFGKDLGGYPVPNRERPQWLQSHRNVPLKIGICTNRSQEACQLREESIEKRTDNR